MKPRHSLNRQIQEVEREIHMRRMVYPRLVGKKYRSKGEIDELIATMESVLETLQELRATAIASKLDKQRS